MDSDPRISFLVGKVSFGSFNLPAIKSCPYRTLACILYCYALKGHFRRRSAMHRHDINFQASKEDSFVDLISKQIKKSLRYFRIHASGDFYSKKYFYKWVEIARRNPMTIFLAYTRNYTLDLTNLPENLIIYYSKDHTTKHASNSKCIAEVVSVDKTKVKHLQPYKNGKFCKSEDCGDCLECWITPGNIYFPQKYKKHMVKKELIELTVM